METKKKETKERGILEPRGVQQYRKKLEKEKMKTLRKRTIEDKQRRHNSEQITQQ